MKRKLSYILIIFISMFMYSGEVYAAEKLFRCEYIVNLSEIVPMIDDVDIKYYVSVYDDGDVVVSDFSNLDALKNGFYVYPASSFKKNYYKQISDNGNSCPIINFTFDGNTVFNFNSTNFVNDVSTVSSFGKIIEANENIEKNEAKEVCIRTKELRNDNIGVQITFYYQGETKMWSVTGFYRSTGTAFGNISEMLSLGDKTFELEQGVIDAAFADKLKCDNTKIYLRTPPGSSLNTVTITKPENSENGSYAVDEAYKDTGLNIEKEDEEKVVTDGKTIELVKRIYNIIKIVIPVLIILLSIVDFLKILIVDDEKNYKSAWDKFIKRLMIGVIFFIVPVLVSFILNYSGIETEQTFLDIFK